MSKEWIKASDGVLNHGDHIIAYAPWSDEKILSGYYDGNANCVVQQIDRDGWKWSFTHWMPIPNPPEGGSHD